MSTPEQTLHFPKKAWDGLPRETQLHLLRGLADRPPKVSKEDTPQTGGEITTDGIGLILSINQPDGKKVAGQLFSGTYSDATSARAKNGSGGRLGNSSNKLPVLVIKALNFEKPGHTTTILANEIKEGQVVPFIPKNEEYPYPSSKPEPLQVNIAPNLLITPGRPGELNIFDASVDGIQDRAATTINRIHDEGLQSIEQAYELADQRFTALEIRIGQTAQKILAASEARFPTP